MISVLAIREYFNRNLRDSNLAKELPEKILDQKIDKLAPRFHTQPRYRHQKVSFLLGLRRKRYKILLDPGLGKSWCSLAIFHYVHRQWKKDHTFFKPRAIILVPGTSNVGQWLDEVHKHTPHLSAVGVDAVGSGNRMLQIRGDSDIVILTYAGFLALVCSGKEGGKGWAIDKKKLKDFCGLFNFFIGDEADAFKNAKSLTFKAVKSLSWACDYAYGLTGTPQGKSPEDLFSQFLVIDKGEALGDTLGLFREAFFTKKKDYFAWFKYEFQKKKSPILNRMLRHSSIRYEEGECGDLPQVIDIVRPVEFTKENFAYYDRLVEELRKAKGNYAETQNSFMRMRQILMGYVSLRNSDGDKLDIRFKENPKLDALLELISEIPPDKKIIVFNEYKISGDIICEALRKAKINHIRLYSGTKDSDKRNVAQRLALPKTRVLVSSSAGARGGNWQIANYSIHVERPCSPILYKQEIKRIDRIGQTQVVRRYDLVVKGSVDEKIIEAHKTGEDLFQKVVNGKADVETLRGKFFK